MKLQKILSAIVLAFVGLILCVSAQAQRTATATPTVANGFVIAITVTDGGSGYTTAPTVTIFGGGGSGAIALATVLNGSVEKVIVQNAGSGYSGTPIVVIAAPPSPKPPFTDGLIAYYPFNGNANDESGKGNNGIVNGATLTTDRYASIDQAFSFNGTGSYIEFPRSTGNIPGAKQLTISTWVKLSKTGLSQAFFGHWSTSTFYGQNVGIILYQSTSNSITISMTGGTGCFGTANLTTNSWHNVVFAFNGDEPLDVNRMRLFIDGQADKLDLSMPSSVPTEVGSLGVSTQLGARGNIEFYSGKIDDVRIYNRALSAQEVEDLYAYESPEQPWLSINVKTVEVTMHVKPTKIYQLEASLDLNIWTKAGAVFTATTSEVIQQFNAIEVGRYFRLSEVP